MLRRLLALLLTLFLAVPFLCAAEGADFPAEDADSPAMVRTGGSFVFVIRKDGKILGWGDNRKGQLGTSPAKLMLNPVPAADGLNGNDILDIQCGNENTLFLMKDGTVYTCGTYSRGTQGLGRLDHIVKTPTRIPELSDIVQITCGFGHNAALDRNGHIWIWGRNDYGQLGTGNKTSLFSPVMLDLEQITSVNCGGKFTLAQDAQGRLWGWGSNTYRVLEDSRKTAILTPLELSGFDGMEITAFSGGSDVAFFLDREGTLWGRGRNEYKQVGSPDAAWKTSPRLTRVAIPEKVAVVCAYSACTAALTDAGNVWIWGSASSGQVGNGSSPNGALPVCGWDQGDAVEIAMGSLISAFRAKDGTIRVSGYNKFGQLGNGNQKSVNRWSVNGVNVNDTD